MMIILRVILLPSLLVPILFFSGAAWSAQVCFQCHEKANFTRKNVHKPVADNKCSTCHNPHVSKYEGLLANKGQKLCFSCHRDLEESLDQDFVHEPVISGQCTVCHDPHSSDNVSLTSVDLASDCLNCHKDLSKKYIYTHEPFASGQCTVCHDPHKSSKMLLLKENPDKLCESCHDFTQLSGIHRKTSQTANNCLSCHNPHGSDRPAIVNDFVHPPFEKDCSVCHDKVSGVVPEDNCIGCHPQVAEKMKTTHTHFTRRDGISCLYCHSPHAGFNSSMLRGNEKWVCYSCHYETLVKFKESSHKHGKIERCTECHEPHGSTSLAMLKGDGTAVCSRCHESQGAFSHPIGDDVLDERTGQLLTCVTCHNPMGTEFPFHLVKDGKEDLCVLCHKTY